MNNDMIGKRCLFAPTAPVRPEHRSSVGKILEIAPHLVHVEWIAYDDRKSESWVPHSYIVVTEAPAAAPPKKREPDLISRLGASIFGFFKN